MDDAQTLHVYEVRCPRCETSFPPEARRCLHCGGKLGGGLLRRAAPVAPAGAAGGAVVRESREAVPAGARGGEAPRPIDLPAEEEELEGQRSGGLLWVATAILAVVGSALRICQGG